MKKLMIAFAVAAMAVASQAATFKWSGASKDAYGVDIAAVTGLGDGTYAQSSTSAMKGNGTFNYVMYVYTAGTDELLGQSAQGTVGYKSTDVKTIQTSVTVNPLEGKTISAGTVYDYKIVITGTQSDLVALGDSVAAKDGTGTFDYTAATLEATLTGQVTPTSGTASFTSSGIDTWTVKGVKFTPGGDVPEPTSGLLLLLGMAGLALRRKIA